MLKVGIIGSGFGLYGLLPAFNSTPGCEVLAICGKKNERLVSYCKKIGLKKIYTNWKTMLDKEELQILALAVPPQVQYEIAKVAIKKGLHIFAEKPLTVTLSQAKELLTLAEKKKIVHAVDFIFPEIKTWKKVKKMIDKKVYGNLEEINSNWDFLSYGIKYKKSSWKTDPKMGGGALSFYFSHCLYYLEYFGGRISDFKSSFTFSKESLNGGEVGVDLELVFENKVEGNAHINCNAKDLNRHQLKFVCENGTIILENENNITANFKVIVVKNSKETKLPLLKEKTNPNEDERVKVVKKMTKRFINSILNNKKFTPSFKEGIRVQELIEKIRIQHA